ncbi:hypothetical protein SISNIDRAFT_487878 [Sistotremastrum niveocremeum HHB9708]|uniref:Uncharacterized protein n=1 Tax=Sistotremastrum niveocremeum HHB9708 TaxID=1314777 RepID=A0A164RT38_9AGAM|nr:hypothetical protein SISNIDRAFT_487878 [Sistotremastrum niveocremeum HHB9708]
MPSFLGRPSPVRTQHSPSLPSSPDSGPVSPSAPSLTNRKYMKRPGSPSSFKSFKSHASHDTNGSGGHGHGNRLLSRVGGYVAAPYEQMLLRKELEEWKVLLSSENKEKIRNALGVGSGKREESEKMCDKLVDALRKASPAYPSDVRRDALRLLLILAPFRDTMSEDTVLDLRLQLETFEPAQLIEILSQVSFLYDHIRRDYWWDSKLNSPFLGLLPQSSSSGPGLKTPEIAHSDSSSSFSSSSSSSSAASSTSVPTSSSSTSELILHALSIIAVSTPRQDTSQFTISLIRLLIQCLRAPLLPRVKADIKTILPKIILTFPKSKTAHETPNYRAILRIYAARWGIVWPFEESRAWVLLSGCLRDRGVDERMSSIEWNAFLAEVVKSLTQDNDLGDIIPFAIYALSHVHPANTPSLLAAIQQTFLVSWWPYYTNQKWVQWDSFLVDLLYLKWRNPRFSELPLEWLGDMKLFLASVFSRSERLSLEFSRRLFSPVSDPSVALASPSKSSTGRIDYYPLTSAHDALLVAALATHGGVKAKLKTYANYEGVKKAMGGWGNWPLDEDGAVVGKYRGMLRKGIVGLGGVGGSVGMNLGNIDEGEEEDE